MFGFFRKFAEAGKIQKAANMGVAEAQFDLNKCYFSKVRTDFENAQAVKWFWKAAEQNHAKAQGCLGLCYATGDGVPRNFIEAYKWFNLASIQGIVSATTHRDNLAASMTPDQIAEAQRLSREFKPRKESAFAN
jgi:uncharacterized protein